MTPPDASPRPREQGREQGRHADALDALGENLAPTKFGTVTGILGHRDVIGEAVVVVVREAALSVALS